MKKAIVVLALLLSSCSLFRSELPPARCGSGTWVCAVGAGPFDARITLLESGEVERFSGELPHIRRVVGIGSAAVDFSVPAGEVCAWQSAEGCDFAGMSKDPNHACGQAVTIRLDLEVPCP